MMRHISMLAILVSTLGTMHFAAWCQQPKWHAKLLRIIALESSKSDVERLYRTARVRRSFVENNVNIVLYETTEGKFSVEYANDHCSSNKVGFPVPKDTLLEMVFFPKDKLPFSAFDIERTDFTEIDDPHDPGTEYVSDLLGITYSVQMKRVIFVRIFAQSPRPNAKCTQITTETNGG